jgi:hypothetical protein
VPPAAIADPEPDAAAELAAADRRVHVESERAERSRDDRRYADAIATLNEVVTRHPEVPGGRVALHSHRSQYLTFQAGRTAERLHRAAPGDRAALRRELHRLYLDTERELRAAVAAATAPGPHWARESAALGLLLCAGAEHGEADRTGDGVRLLREVLRRGTGLSGEDGRRIRLDLATALTISASRHGDETERAEAETILTALERPGDPPAGAVAALRAELAAIRVSARRGTVVDGAGVDGAAVDGAAVDPGTATTVPSPPAGTAR